MAINPLNWSLPLAPPAVLLFQLLLGSSMVGFTPSKSSLRLSTTPVICSCVYIIATTASRHVRTRWSSLLGGISFAFLLQYIDIALLSRFEFKDELGGEATSVLIESFPALSQACQAKPRTTDTNYFPIYWKRFMFGWSSLWSFRHVNTVHEVRNVPPFSQQNPNYVPSRWTFVAQRTIAAVACYLVLDLLDAKPSPPNQYEIFDSSLIPVFRRIGNVTGEQIKLRALSIVGFAVTFYCIIQGYHSTMGALTVGLGLSKAENWKPIFGSILDAYSVRNFWGKVWHQSLRQMITSPATFVASELLKIPRKSMAYQYTTIVLAFGNSALLHYVAGLSSGASPRELAVFHFFCTQALGVAIETAVQKLYRRLKEGESISDRPNILWRCLGYFWVMGFMTWSGPAWLYPSAAVAPPKQDSNSFLPFSLIRAMKDVHNL